VITGHVAHDKEEVFFQVTTSINYDTQDTAYFLQLSLITHMDYHIQLDYPLHLKTGDMWNYYGPIDSTVYHKPIFEPIRDFGFDSEYDSRYYDYFMNKVTYEIDRKFLEDLYNLGYCQYIVFITKGDITGYIDIENTSPKFITYYERYISKQ